MPAQTRRSSSKGPSSSEHLHPSSAATTPSKSTDTTPAASSSSSSGSTVTHPPSAPASANEYDRANAFTLNPIRLIERNLFRAYWNIEGTFSLSMLEAWEVFLVICVFITLTLLLCYTMIHYLPRHAKEVANRVLYYVYGNSPPSTLAAVVTQDQENVTAKVVEATSAAGERVLERLIENSQQLWQSLEGAEKGNKEVVDRLISNLNKVKQMMGGAKPEL